jgi:hypothetical protein
MSSSTSNTPIAYTSTEDLVKVLNLQQSTVDPTKYMVWQIPTSTDVLNTFVRYANEQTTSLFGDISQSSSYGLAKQYATWRAVLNLIDTMTVNWVISGLPVQLGNIGIDRLAAMQAASTVMRERAISEAQRLYVLLTEIDFPNNYQSPSPYVDTGGQSFYS